jgi:hypothetical protein
MNLNAEPTKGVHVDCPNEAGADDGSADLAPE